MLEFTAKKDRQELRVTIVKLKGHYNMARLEGFRRMLYNKLRKRPDVLAFECSELDFFDSSAIGAMVNFFKTTRERRIEFIFYDLKPLLVELFKITKLDSYFSIMTKEKFKEEYLKESCLV